MIEPVVRNRFLSGYGSISTIIDRPEMLMDVGFLNLHAEEAHDSHDDLERAYVLLSGAAIFSFGSIEHVVKRSNPFDENPVVLHGCPYEHLHIVAKTDCEFLVVKTANDQSFATTLFTDENLLEYEHRGQGLLNDTAYRLVKTVIDTRNRPTANLVLGEVVNFSGRWSSYPPHHHPQPEIYHYRFRKTQGYGHAEVGEDVFKIRHGDTVFIPPEHDHAQVSAPGYDMMYVWVIRHLPHEPYKIPTFAPEHEWARQQNNNEQKI